MFLTHQPGRSQDPKCASQRCWAAPGGGGGLLPRLQNTVLSFSISLYTYMYFLTCFPFQWFFKRTGVRKHRWVRAGSVRAACGRLRTALEIFRSLGRPRAAREGWVFWVFFWFGVGFFFFFHFLLIDLECSPLLLSRFYFSSPGITCCCGWEHRVPWPRSLGCCGCPGLDPSTCPCFPSCGEASPGRWGGYERPSITRAAAEA